MTNIFLCLTCGKPHDYCQTCGYCAAREWTVGELVMFHLKGADYQLRCIAHLKTFTTELAGWREGDAPQKAMAFEDSPTDFYPVDFAIKLHDFEGAARALYQARSHAAHLVREMGHGDKLAE